MIWKNYPYLNRFLTNEDTRTYQDLMGFQFNNFIILCDFFKRKHPNPKNNATGSPYSTLCYNWYFFESMNKCSCNNLLVIIFLVNSVQDSDRAHCFKSSYNARTIIQKYLLIRNLQEGVKQVQAIFAPLVSTHDYFVLHFHWHIMPFEKKREILRNKSCNIYHIFFNYWHKNIQRLINEWGTIKAVFKTDLAGKGSSIQLVESDTWAICSIMLLLKV